MLAAELLLKNKKKKLSFNLIFFHRIRNRAKTLVTSFKKGLNWTFCSKLQLIFPKALLMFLDQLPLFLATQHDDFSIKTVFVSFDLMMQENLTMMCLFCPANHLSE